MHDWMDFNRDGEVDWSEKVLAAEMLCTSREEHNALFGDDGDFDDDAETDDADFEYDAIIVLLHVNVIVSIRISTAGIFIIRRTLR